MVIENIKYVEKHWHRCRKQTYISDMNVNNYQ